MSKEMRIMRAIGEIDDAYIDEAAPVIKSKAMRFNAWAKYAGIAAAAVLATGVGVFVMTRNNGVGVIAPAQTTAVTQQPVTVTEPAVTETEPSVTATEPGQTTETTEDMPMVLFGNPFEEYNTPEEAAEAAGFGIAAPESFGIYTERSFAVYYDNLSEIIYRDSAGNEGLCIRKAAGKEDDISGTYYSFETVIPSEIDGRKVTMSGVTNSDGSTAIYKAVWTDGEYTYSVTAPYDPEDTSGTLKGLTQTETEEIIKNVK